MCIHHLLQLQPLAPRGLAPRIPQVTRERELASNILGSPQERYFWTSLGLLLAIAQCWTGVWNTGFGESLGELNVGKPGTPGLGKMEIGNTGTVGPLADWRWG